MIVRVPDVERAGLRLYTPSLEPCDYAKPNRIYLIVTEAREYRGEAYVALSPVSSFVKEPVRRDPDHKVLPLRHGDYGGLIYDDDHFQIIELCGWAALKHVEVLLDRADFGDFLQWNAIQAAFRERWPRQGSRKRLWQLFKDFLDSNP